MGLGKKESVKGNRLVAGKLAKIFGLVKDSGVGGNERGFRMKNGEGEGGERETWTRMR